MSTLSRVSLIFSLASILAFPLLAEPTTEPATTDDTATEPDITVVITDTRVAHPISESIASATVVTAQEIRQQGAQTVADALRLVPGVTVRQSGQMGGATSTSIRGSKPNQVLVLVDGQRVANSSFIGGTDLAKFPVEDISRIEVIRGPVSSLYGSEAFGGVVNIITKRPTVSGGDARLSTGSNGRGARAFMVRSANDPVPWMISGSFPTFNGDRDNSDFDAKDFSARVNLPNVKGWEMSLLGENYQDDQGLPGATTYPSPTDEQSFDRTNASISAKREIDGGQMEWQAYTVNQLIHYKSLPYYESRTGGLTNATDFHYTRSWGQHEWTLGGEYRNESNTNRASDLAVPTHYSINNRALYAQDRWKINGLTDMVFGARLDDHSTAGSKITPRVGINRAVAKNTNVRASYAVGFRAPNFVELYSYYPDYYNPDARYGTIGNPNLKPETSQQIELGVNATRGKTSVDFAVFNTNVRDGILYSTYTGTPIPMISKTYTNVTRTRQRGMELSLVHQLGSATNMTLSYSYIDARDKSNGQRLIAIPYNTVDFTLASTIRRYDVALTGRWIEERPDVGNTTIPSGTVFDLAIQQRGKGLVQPYLTIRNLMNASYEDVVGYPAEGRSIEFGLTSAW